MFGKIFKLLKEAYARRQDDSLYTLRKLIKQGYTHGVWTLHETHPEYDICDTLDGKVIDLNKLVSGLQYAAPIFEMSHVQCICRLICYSTTNPELDYITVDWKGETDEGRMVDQKDKYERSKDFYRLYNRYRKKLDELRTNKYLTGKSSNPDAGLYTFEIVLSENYYYNPDQKQKASNAILDIILNEADRHKLKVEESNLVSDEFFVRIEYPLTMYDFSKKDLMDITWTLKERRAELEEVMIDLDNIKEWLKATQDKINSLLISYEVEDKPIEEESNQSLVDEYEKKNVPNIVEQPKEDKIKSFEELKIRIDEMNKNIEAVEPVIEPIENEIPGPKDINEPEEEEEEWEI